VRKIAFYNVNVSMSAASNGSAITGCPVCGESDRIAFAFERNGNRIHSCKRCTLEFSFPQPTDETLAAIYSGEYFLGSKDQDSLKRQELLKRATARLYLDAIAPFVPEPGARLLEIGCGSGDFLAEARSRGFEVEGLEYSAHAVKDANMRLGSSAVRAGSPEQKCLPDGAYDVIAAFDVVEHLRNPRQSIEYLRAALKSRGLLAIVTPSTDSWSRQILGRHWMEYKTEHLTYFSRESMKQLLHAAGFDGIRFLPNYKTLSFDYISAHFERFPVPLASPLVRLVRKALPANLAYRPVQVVASGMMALATKRD
jgi:2-polyprenyl-3-methyl-5-hydroxy-6-metoxy-1,4-benzoquinol methylase